MNDILPVAHDAATTHAAETPADDDGCMCEFPPDCGGMGVLMCDGCGGDQCVCVCGGECECFGCAACGDGLGDDDDWPDDRATA